MPPGDPHHRIQQRISPYLNLKDGTVRVVEGVPVNLTPSLVAPAP